MKENSIFDYNSDDVRSGSVQPVSGENVLPPEVIEKKRRVRKMLYYLVVAVISIALSAALIYGMVNRLNNGLVMELQPGDIYPVQMEDGKYSGSFTSGGMSAAVTVEIGSGCITDISLNAFNGIDTARAQRVFAAVLISQSLDVAHEDVGAAPTDKILLMAIENAFAEEEEQ